jgi:hypothetical protein
VVRNCSQSIRSCASRICVASGASSEELHKRANILFAICKAKQEGRSKRALHLENTTIRVCLPALQSRTSTSPFLVPSHEHGVSPSCRSGGSFSRRSCGGARSGWAPTSRPSGRSTGCWRGRRTSSSCSSRSTPITGDRQSEPLPYNRNLSPSFIKVWFYTAGSSCLYLACGWAG